jgi:hypothetical protein
MENNFWNKGSKWAFEDMQDVNSRISFEIKEIIKEISCLIIYKDQQNFG